MDRNTEIKMVSLSDLLTPEQISHSGTIMAETEGEGEQLKKLTAYYETFKDDLEAKGVIPGYLALIVVHTVGSIVDLADEMATQLIRRNAATN